MEKEAGLVRGAEQLLGDGRTAVSVDDGARLQSSTADLQIIVDGFGGEVQKLDVDSCGQTQAVSTESNRRQEFYFWGVSYQNQWVRLLSTCSLIHLGSCQGNRGLESLHSRLS